MMNTQSNMIPNLVVKKQNQGPETFQCSSCCHLQNML
jgi:hypothetical protein